MMNSLKKESKIFVAGGSGMVGEAIIRSLSSNSYSNIIAPTRKELNLFNSDEVSSFLLKNKPDQIFLAAAKVGGIEANDKNKHQFLYENLLIQNNVIYGAHSSNLNNLIFFGSSCVYPNNIREPIKETDLLMGPLEETNEGYALAKICGIKLCNYLANSFKRNYFSIMPCNLFGERDNFDLETSHVIPALLQKFHNAKLDNKNKITIWGSGKAKREFMHVDDLADASVYLMNCKHQERIINVGTSKDITISELVCNIAEIVGYDGIISYDPKMKEGTMRKVLNTEILNNLGWSPNRDFITELKLLYNCIKNTKKIELDIGSHEK